MIYQLKTGCYKTFHKFSDNLLIPRSYFIPFSSLEELEGTDPITERYHSSRVEVLSGDWDFIYYSKESQMPDSFDSSSVPFDRISVPSTWQHTGYEPPCYINTRYPFQCNPPHFPEDCPVGVYRKTFEISGGNHYTLQFLGVAGSLDLFCNGKYVGYSEGSHNTAEFELDDFLTRGMNEIIAVNHKWCTGTYLECQDMFRCNGIFRDVLLIKTMEHSIYDIEIKTNYKSDGKYDLQINPSVKLTERCDFSAALFLENQPIISSSVNLEPGEAAHAILFTELEAEEWSAEIPKLYTLILTLSSNGRVVEVIRRQIGFKHIHIDGNVFLFNNKPVKLLGVNHHDTNSKTGYVLTAREMEQDIAICKEYNVNCIRTSHYPPDPIFLDLCDKYGIYVIDEADIETHGVATELKKPNLISNDSKWAEHYWDRVFRMFSRDKNHACVVMWSLGNEAGGWKNQDLCCRELKQLTELPIHYEGASRTPRWAYDVLSEMYPPQGRTAKISAGKGLLPKYYKKPYFMCEYAHAMGLGAGDLEVYVQHIYGGKNMMGGCIWEFADHAVYHSDGPNRYTYGGDHGEQKHDSNFCVDGLFFPDRTPHPGAFQMKNCYRPVRCRKQDGHDYQFTSCLYFASISLSLRWKLLSNGEIVAEGMEALILKPGESRRISLEYTLTGHEKNHNVIVFEYFSKERSVGCEQIVLNDPIPTAELPEGPAPEVQISERNLLIFTRDGRIVYNTQTGFFESCVYRGQELFCQVPLGQFCGIGVQLYRAPLDNDMYFNQSWERLDLKNAVVYADNKNIAPRKAYRITDRCVELQNTFTVKTPKCRFLARVNMTAQIYSSGEIRFEFQCLSSRRLFCWPRFGIVLETPKALERVRYYGMGPYPGLSDFKEHCTMGVYGAAVSDLHEKYIKPQESAVRTDVRWAEVTDAGGRGFRFEALEKPFLFSANHYTSRQCVAAAHEDDLAEYDTTCVSIDGYMLGAGSNSCGPVPAKNRRLPSLKGQTLKFTMKPIGD